MIRRTLPALLVLLPALVCAGSALAHEGDAEDRAMRLHGLLIQLDRSWAAAQRESEPGTRAALLETHGRTLLALQQSLREAADKSPCILMEKTDNARQLACLVDTEARLRTTERLIEHLVNRLAIAGR